MKKYLLLLLVSIISQAAFATEAGTVYYAGNYETPYIWAWNNNPTAYNYFTAWPGEPMVDTGKTYEGNKLWSYTFEDSLPEMVIFSNWGSPQTGDMKLPGENYVYTESGWRPLSIDEENTIHLDFPDINWGDNIVSSKWWSIYGNSADDMWTVTLSTKSTEYATGDYTIEDMLYAKVGYKNSAEDEDFTYINFTEGTFNLKVGSYTVSMTIIAKGEDGKNYNCTLQGINYYPSYIKHPWSIDEEDPWTWKMMEKDDMGWYAYNGSWYGYGCNINTMASNYGALWFEPQDIQFVYVDEDNTSVVTPITPEIGSPATYRWNGELLQCIYGNSQSGIQSVNADDTQTTCRKYVKDGTLFIIANGRRYNALGQ